MISLDHGNPACLLILLMSTFSYQSMLSCFINFSSSHAIPSLEAMPLSSGDVCSELESLAKMDAAEIACKAAQMFPQNAGLPAAEEITSVHELEAAPTCRSE